MDEGKTILAYGGGTNSTALIVGWVERGLPTLDAILFADTGAEKPHTYEHLAVVNEYLQGNGHPQITVVQRTRRDQTLLTLEGYSLERSRLPSLAYGFKSCSQKHKVQPQDKWLNRNMKAEWKAGHKPTKLIGYDYAEPRRWMRAKIEDEKYFYRFPLVEWRMDRPACEAAILSAGLPIPGKSACFFCPASTKLDILELQRTYPDLLQRALAMEDKARPHLTSAKGLGRRFAWRDFLEGQDTPENDGPVCGACMDYAA